jgi:hypothetical protein
MEPPLIRPARPGDAADLARNWVDVARHYAELDADAFQVPGVDGLVAWFEGLLRRPRPPDAIWLVAELDGQVVGDVSARLERPADDREAPGRLTALWHGPRRPGCATGPGPE